MTAPSFLCVRKWW